MTDYSDHPKCATCHHWQPTDEWDTPHGFKRCIAAPMSSEVGEWCDDLEAPKIRPEFAKTMMSAMDGSSYMAHVHTRVDFYCPMHSDLKGPNP